MSDMDPLVIKVQPNFSKYVLVSIDGKNTAETLSYIEASYNKFSPKYHFESWPLETAIANLYQNEQKSSRLILLFSILGIIITSLGILGLIDYSLKLRTKEIGIRKVLGAKPILIINIFLKEYGNMILFASTIAWSASYYYFSNWLDNYAYKNPIKIWYFLGASLITIIITTAIILVKTYYTARMNPSKAIKAQ